MPCPRNCNDCCECLSPHDAGKTCNDCLHVARCKALFGQKGHETFCQFVPARIQYARAEPCLTS